jgi:hypothetical protein
MSIVSDFARSMASQAFAMIGEEPVTIGGTTLQCVLAEVDDSKDFSTGGFEVVKRLSAVCRTADLPATSVLKKLATARGQSFRVEGVSKGVDFATLTLEQVEKS